MSLRAGCHSPQQSHNDMLFTCARRKAQSRLSPERPPVLYSLTSATFGQACLMAIMPSANWTTAVSTPDISRFL